MKQKKHILFNDPFEVFLAYHRQYLWDFLEVLFKWSGIPDTVDLRFFNDKLITDGWAPVVYYDEKRGYLTFDGAKSGLDWYYRPTTYRSTNPVLKAKQYEVSYYDNVKKNGACICFNTCDYRHPVSFTQLVEVYAYKLAQADVSIVVSLENSRATLVPAVSDKESAARVVDALKDIYAGKPATIAYKNSFSGQPDFQIIPIKAKDNIITAELTDSKRQIMAEFLTRIGINVTPVDKKERLVAAEATSNSQEIYLNGCIYLEARERFCKDLQATFGLDAGVVINVPAITKFMEEGGLNNEYENQGTTDIDSESRA